MGKNKMKQEFNIADWVFKNKLKEQEGEDPEYLPYMYSPIGFGCHVCKFYYVENEKHMCSNKQYQEYKGTAELVDDEGNQIKDPSKWCSNWFMPKEEND
jgi:hypothetical protein